MSNLGAATIYVARSCVELTTYLGTHPHTQGGVISTYLGMGHGYVPRLTLISKNILNCLSDRHKNLTHSVYFLPQGDVVSPHNVMGDIWWDMCQWVVVGPSKSG